MGGGGPFDGQALAWRPAARLIQRPAERVDDASQQFIAHSHIHDPARAFDFIARVQCLIIAEQHHADFILVHVERDAEHAAGKRHQFLEPHAGKPGDLGDAGGNADDRAHLARRELRREGSQRLADPGERAVKDTLQTFRSGGHRQLTRMTEDGSRMGATFRIAH